MSCRPEFMELGPPVDPSQVDVFRKLAGKFEYFELKYDGWWGELVTGPEGWKLYSRSGQVKLVGETPLPKGHLLGEYCVGTQWSTSHPEVYGKLMCFEVKVWEGEATTHGGLDLVETVAELHRLHPGMKFVDTVEAFVLDEAQDVWWERVVKGGWEGLVFKGKGGWAKMKKYPTMDYVVVGVAKSDADRFKGREMARALIGGLYVDGELKTKVSISGLTDGEREEFWSRRAELIGKVFEAQGRAVFHSGALRHPAFLRWRDDKKPFECTWGW